jgi:hypothetical protein
MRSWIGAMSSFAGTVMTAKVRSHMFVVGSRQFSQIPATRTPRRRDAKLRNASRGIFLEKAVHRHDTPTLAVGIPKHPLFRDGLGPGMDWLQVRPGVKVVRNQSPS